MNEQPNSIRDDQFRRLMEILGRELHLNSLSLPAAQLGAVLENEPSLVVDFVSLLRKRVERLTGQIVRRVNVNPAESLRAIISDLHRIFDGEYRGNSRFEVCLNSAVEVPAPPCSVKEVIIFKADCELNDEQLVIEYRSRNLIPADVRSLLRVVRDDPELVRCFTHWQDSKGQWCYASLVFQVDGMLSGHPRLEIDKRHQPYRNGSLFVGLPVKSVV